MGAVRGRHRSRLDHRTGSARADDVRSRRGCGASAFGRLGGGTCGMPWRRQGWARRGGCRRRGRLPSVSDGLAFHRGRTRPGRTSRPMDVRHRTKRRAGGSPRSRARTPAARARVRREPSSFDRARADRAPGREPRGRPGRAHRAPVGGAAAASGRTSALGHRGSARMLKVCRTRSSLCGDAARSKPRCVQPTRSNARPGGLGRRARRDALASST